MSGLSNYPPGVTGNEIQIAGANEFTLHRTCDNQNALWVPRNIVDLLLHNLALVVKVTPGSDAFRVEWDRLADEHSAEFACDFEGDVDVQEWEGIVTWECPRCGAEQENDYGDEMREAAAEDAADRMRDER